MDTFSDYEDFDAIGLASLVKSKVVTPLELLEAAISRIETRNPQLNAVIYKMYDQAYALIKTALPFGSFQGVPFLLKDLFADCAITPMHFGSRLGQGYVSLHDSELTKRFKNAGLIIIGKTNTPEFGLSPFTEPELFGPTLNPWDITRTPGGSSGGAAVAVASGMVPMAHGSDGAGSLRIPAAYCGLFSLKPSRGRTPSGSYLMRIWQGMVVEHVISRSVRDNAAMLDALAGPELGSLFLPPTSQHSFFDSLALPLKPLRIAYTAQPFFRTEVDSSYHDALLKAAQLCETLGHTVEPATLVINSEEVALANLIVIAGETACSLKMLTQFLQRKLDKNELEVLTAVLCAVGEHFNAKDFAWASHILDAVSRSAAAFFEKFDVLLTPTMAVPPSQIGEFRPEGFEKNILELLSRIPYGPLLRKLTEHSANKYFGYMPYTPIFNVTGQPAMSVPLYWDAANLPIGMQFAGRYGEEHLLLQLAKQLEDAQPWWSKRPLCVKSSRDSQGASRLNEASYFCVNDSDAP